MELIGAGPVTVAVGMACGKLCEADGICDFIELSEDPWAGCSFL